MYLSHIEILCGAFFARYKTCISVWRSDLSKVMWKSNLKTHFNCLAVDLCLLHTLYFWCYTPPFKSKEVSIGSNAIIGFAKHSKISWMWNDCSYSSVPWALRAFLWHNIIVLSLENVTMLCLWNAPQGPSSVSALTKWETGIFKIA